MSGMAFVVQNNYGTACAVALTRVAAERRVLALMRDTTVCESYRIVEVDLEPSEQNAPVAQPAHPGEGSPALTPAVGSPGTELEFAL